MKFLILFLFTSHFSFVIAKDNRQSFFTDNLFKTKVSVKQLGLDNPKSILLVHGLGTNASKDWDPIKNQLAKEYHVIMIDLPGFGMSEKSPKLYTPENYAKLLSQVVKKFSKSKKSIVMGHSLGGATVLKFAHEYPQLIEKLILIDVAGILHRSIFVKHISLFENKPQEDYLFKGVVDKVKSTLNTLTENIIEFTDKYTSLQDFFLKNAKIRAKLAKDQTMVRAAIALIEENFTDAINNLEIPTLIIWGEVDRVAPLRVAKLLHYHLKNSKLNVLKKIGHNPMTEAPKKVVASIFSWLSNSETSIKTELEKRDKTFSCDGKKDIYLNGGFSSITLKDCNNVTFKNVHLNNLILDNSSVIMENVVIDTDQIAISAKDSVVTATNLVINAEVGMKLDESKMDLAGAHLNTKKDAIQFTDKSFIYWSVSKIKEKNSSIKIMHQRTLYQEE